MQRFLHLSLLCLMFVVAGLFVGRQLALGSNELSGIQRPAHLPESVAHQPALQAQTAAVAGMQNGYTLWNNQAVFRTLNTYQTPVTFNPSVKYDMIVDFVLEGGQACVYDFFHCKTVDSSFYAYITRYSDLNVASVVWNGTGYDPDPTHNPVDGQPFNNYIGRHELGHDQRLADHSLSYDGLMCNSDTCTRRYEPNTAELDSAAASFVARPIPASGISATVNSATKITINFSGHGNADSLVPFRGTGAGWTELGTIAASSTSYQFINLVPNTTYYLRIASRKAGQPDGTSHWVVATTQSLARPTNFKIDANSSTLMSLTWSAVEGAASYERCVSGDPNAAPGSWICAGVGSVTSDNPAIVAGPHTIFYFAIRAVDANGQK